MIALALSGGLLVNFLYDWLRRCVTVPRCRLAWNEANDPTSDELIVSLLIHITICGKPKSATNDAHRSEKVLLNEDCFV